VDSDCGNETFREGIGKRSILAVQDERAGKQQQAEVERVRVPDERPQLQVRSSQQDGSHAAKASESPVVELRPRPTVLNSTQANSEKRSGIRS